MTKADLIEAVASAKNLPKKDVEAVLEAVVEAIQQALRNNEKVSVSGLGTFTVKDRKARTARNPKTGEAVQVPASKAAKFKMGKELKEILQG